MSEPAGTPEPSSEPSSSPGTFSQVFSKALEGNTVTVTVSYDWVPEALLGTGVTLSSTSVMPMSY